MAFKMPKAIFIALIVLASNLHSGKEMFQKYIIKGNLEFRSSLWEIKLHYCQFSYVRSSLGRNDLPKLVSHSSNGIGL